MSCLTDGQERVEVIACLCRSLHKKKQTQDTSASEDAIAGAMCDGIRLSSRASGMKCERGYLREALDVKSHRSVIRLFNAFATALQHFHEHLRDVNSWMLPI
jgi:hypothetical protein